MDPSITDAPTRFWPYVAVLYGVDGGWHGDARDLNTVCADASSGSEITDDSRVLARQATTIDIHAPAAGNCLWLKPGSLQGLEL